jgi:hypothetical protein
MESDCRKALARLQDANVYYRSVGARDLIALGKQGRLKKGESLSPELWSELFNEALDKLKREIDDDVKRFVLEILSLMDAPRNEKGDYDSEGAPTMKRKKNLITKDCDFKWQSYNPWRSALLRAIRGNRTDNCKRMEMVSTRVNHTKINRAISFRGFVPDSPGHGRDRLYTVVDARIEKAEQNLSVARQPPEAHLFWSFAQTEERFEITGLLTNIKAHRGEKAYGVWDDCKAPAAAEEEGQLHLRRIAWNACSDMERAAFRFPSTHDDSTLFPAAADSRRAVGLMRRALQALCIDPRTQELRDPAAVFRAMDRDAGGTLNLRELRDGLRASRAALTEEEAGELFAAMDPARSGEVEELVRRLVRRLQALCCCCARDAGVTLGAGQVEQAAFSRFVRSMPIPDAFWVRCVENPRLHPTPQPRRPPADSLTTAANFLGSPVANWSQLPSPIRNSGLLRQVRCGPVGRTRVVVWCSWGTRRGGERGAAGAGMLGTGSDPNAHVRMCGARAAPLVPQPHVP